MNEDTIGMWLRVNDKELNVSVIIVYACSIFSIKILGVGHINMLYVKCMDGYSKSVVKKN
jgi:hypothetical protein